MALESLAKIADQVFGEREGRVKFSTLVMVWGFQGRVPFNLARRTMEQAEAVADLMAARLTAPRDIKPREFQRPRCT